MVSLAGDVLVGAAFGILIGVTLAFLFGLGSFYLRYATDQELDQKQLLGAIAGVGLLNVLVLGLIEIGLGVVFRLSVATAVFLVLGLYGYSQGRVVGSAVPRDTSLPTERKRHLSANALDAVDGMGQVTIRSAGEIHDLDGYPPLAPDIRARLEAASWQLPADLPLSELGNRLEARLASQFGLAAVRVTVDGRGRATIAAAPPDHGLSRQVPDGWRAVTVDTVIPTGLASGDNVVFQLADSSIGGVVLDTTIEVSPVTQRETESSENATAESPASDAAIASPIDSSPGGPGQVTAAVPTADAGSLLEVDRAAMQVKPHSSSSDLAAFTTLEAADYTVRKLQVDADTLETLPEYAEEIRIIAIRPPEKQDDHTGWIFEPGSNEEGSRTNRSSGIADSQELTLDEPALTERGNEAPPAEDLLKPGAEAFIAGETAVLDLFGDGADTPSVEAVEP